MLYWDREPRMEVEGRDLTQLTGSRKLHYINVKQGQGVEPAAGKPCQRIISLRIDFWVWGAWLIHVFVVSDFGFEISPPAP